METKRANAQRKYQLLSRSSAPEAKKESDSVIQEGTFPDMLKEMVKQANRDKKVWIQTPDKGKIAPDTRLITGAISIPQYLALYELELLEEGEWLSAKELGAASVTLNALVKKELAECGRTGGNLGRMFAADGGRRYRATSLITPENYPE